MTDQLDLFGGEPVPPKRRKRSRKETGSKNMTSAELVNRIEAMEGRFDRIEQSLLRLHELIAVNMSALLPPICPQTMVARKKDSEHLL